ncbi:MAG TPA: type II secretion system minor pseudopilin GspI [Nevskiaceae bacterium]
MNARARTTHAPNAGFTLLEVLVAVAVLAIAMGAIITAAGRYAQAAETLQNKTLALWVAHNRLAEMELAPTWPPVGTSRDDVTMGHRKWTWNVTVQATEDPTIRRVDVHVSPKDHEQDTVASLTAFLSSAGRDGAP